MICIITYYSMLFNYEILTKINNLININIISCTFNIFKHSH
nr:MAG TPA: hypothetical protein [Bacteriophage sp.]